MKQFFSFAFALALYASLFFMQESVNSGRQTQLSIPLPATVQKIAWGYMRQLGGEIAFIRASVFLGGLDPGHDPEEYASPLAATFRVAAELHPQFVDTYFFTEAFLPHIGEDWARSANEILTIGIDALPDNWNPYFFKGFNHFYYLNEPLEAAKIFHAAAQCPDGPAALEHFAQLLTAEGGDIYAALIGLRAMHAAEQDEHVRKRYEKEIAMFEKVVVVLSAIKQYETDHGASPDSLIRLIPKYIGSIPDIGPVFTLEWQPPHLKVVRVVKMKNRRQ